MHYIVVLVSCGVCQQSTCSGEWANYGCASVASLCQGGSGGLMFADTWFKQLCIGGPGSWCMVLAL